MYAVIKAGGKQHKVKPGDVIEIELVHGGTGDTVEFHPLLVVDDEGKTHYGKAIARAVVTAELVGEKKGDKVKVFKYRPKTGYAKSQGHRQQYTLIEVKDIKLEARRSTRKTKAEEPEPEDAEPEKAEATADGE